MVKKSVLEKLSSNDLEKYIRQDSQFVSEAVQFAYEILAKRGRIFSETETTEIHNLIELKKENEKIQPPPANGWDKNLVEDDSAIKLYTNQLIWFFSILFGVIFGTALQVYNYAKIKNFTGLIVTLVFGILYTLLQISISNYFEENPINARFGRHSLTFILSGFGAVGLFAIREFIIPIKISYQSKSFLIPLIISIIIYIPILFIIFKGI